ncbi:MAG: hypothetical protein Q4E09_00965 [Eubacteriales bacterium]|nr:hypothetical protein [Eubacteriales bacterium]
MTQRKALKTLAIIILTSLILLLVTVGLRKAKPELYLEANRESPEELAMARYALLDNLEPADNEPKIAELNDRGILAWPVTSTLKEFHKTDLSLFRDRSQNEFALQGITVFIDAGEVEAPAPITQPGERRPVEEPAKNLAPTDPYTGLPVSDYQPPSAEEEEETTQAPEKMLAPKEFLPTVEQRLKHNLEAMGATVYLTRETATKPSEIAQQAYIANFVAQGFLEELKDSKFRSQDVERLIPNLLRAIDEPDAEEARRIFTANGISPSMRLLLDVERQYKEIVVISLRAGSEDADTAEPGARISYYGNQAAAGFGAGAWSEDRPQDQPAYVAYDSSSRRNLAEKIAANFKEYLPELLYQGSQGAVSEKNVISGRYNNLISVEVLLGEVKHENNLELLARESNLRKLADAISLSVYQFYCN